MRKLLPVLFAAATVISVVSTAHAEYTLVARQSRFQHNQSAEILRVHASVSVMMQQTLEQPTLPPVVAARKV